MEVFQHAPLEDPTRWFRLLKLERRPVVDTSQGWHDLPIALTIHDFFIGCGPHHQALSYMWGPVQPTKTITIDNRSINVRLNLYEFFKTYLADEDCKGYF